MFYVYVLRIKNTGRYYIGQTQDITKRLEKHRRGETKSIKNRGEFELVHAERYSSRSDAMKREKEIKNYKGGEAFRRLIKNLGETAEVPPQAG